MKLGGSRGVIAACLLVTLVAAYLAPPAAGDAVVLSERVASRSTSTVPAPLAASTPRSTRSTLAVQVLPILPRDAQDGDDDESAVFATRQWTPPAAPVAPIAAAVPASAAEPVAPPLPFRVLGRFNDDGQSGVFLQHNDQNLIVRAGDTLAGTYKVEALEGTTLTLRHLPTNQQQTLQVGASN